VASGTNPLAGRSAFVNRSHGYVSSRAALASLAGQSVRFRFRLGEDVSANTGYGWFVDDVRIYTCQPIPAPAVEVTQVAEQTAVVAGESIDLEVTVENTGNVALTGIDLASLAAPDCEQPVADLAPAASVAVDCTYTTVDPDDIGPWSATATVDADQVDPVESAPVEVTVLAAGTPAATVTATANETSVVAGEVIGLHTTIHNTGNVALTELSLDHSTASSCGGDVADLAPEAQQTIDCNVVTDLDDVGPWSDTATLTATELPGGVTASPVNVQVVAPAPSASVTHEADVDTIDLGQAVPLGVTVVNTGNVKLTGVTVSAPDAPDCAAGPVGPH